MLSYNRENMTGLCTAGYYCPNGSVSAEDIDCPVGHYCPLGSSAPQPCQNGTFSDNIRLTAQVSAVERLLGDYFFIRFPFVSNKKRVHSFWEYSGSK